MMSAEETLLGAEDRMEKAIQVLKSSLAGIRTGRANPALVDSLRVEVYGASTPIKQLATVGAPEPTQIPRTVGGKEVTMAPKNLAQHSERT